MTSIIQAAGWPIWPLIIASIVALAIVIERTMALRVQRVLPAQLVDAVLMVWSKAGQGAAAKACGASALGYTLAAALSPALNSKRQRGGGSFFTAGEVAQPQTTLQERRAQAVSEEGRRQVAALNRYLGALAAIASAAPLMGLLGTVIGMIEMFTAQSSGPSGDPSALASGIAVALYNTAFGLIVAIPALLFWRGLKSRVNYLQLELELESARFLRLAPDETLA